MTRALILGAGGFIGSHLAQRLKEHGYYVRGVDLKPPEWGRSAADEFLIGDLRRGTDAIRAFGDGFDEVYQLAADMGGLGYISYHFADVMRGNLYINLNVADAARMIGVGRLIFSRRAVTCSVVCIVVG
jgi:nucleoside-diphosphate-sugar epimerase